MATLRLRKVARKVGMGNVEVEVRYGRVVRETI